MFLKDTLVFNDFWNNILSDTNGRRKKHELGTEYINQDFDKKGD